MENYNLVSAFLIIFGVFIIYNVLSLRFKIWIISKGVQDGLKKYYDESKEKK